jgi:regulatory protein
MKQERSTYERALDLLSFRPRSVLELRQRLAKQGAPASEIEMVIERLLDQKLLDDAAFARQFARSKVVGAGASRRRIVQELARKGIARNVADEAVSDLQESEGIDPSAAIHRVADKKWRSLSGVDDFTRRRRLYAFLARRGFNPDEIRGVMNALGAEVEH